MVLLQHEKREFGSLHPLKSVHVRLTGWCGLQEAWDTPDDAEAGGELRDAESSLSEYSGRLGGAWWQKFAEVCECSLAPHMQHATACIRCVLFHGIERFACVRIVVLTCAQHVLIIHHIATYCY